MKKISYSLLLVSGLAFGQFFEKGKTFTKQDTLKGSNTEFRNFWDVKKYELSVEANFQQKSIAGNNKISFEITKDISNPVFQIDLQQPMKVDVVQCSFPTPNHLKEMVILYLFHRIKILKKEKNTPLILAIPEIRRLQKEHLGTEAGFSQKMKMEIRG